MNVTAPDRWISRLCVLLLCIYGFGLGYGQTALALIESVVPVWDNDAELTIVHHGGGDITLSWGTATDADSGIGGYQLNEVHPNGDGSESYTVVANLGSDQYTHEITDLLPGEYIFSVLAWDLADISNSSAMLYATVTVSPPPSWPASPELVMSNATESSVDLSWPAAVDNGSFVAGYNVYVNDGFNASVDGTTVTTTVYGLSPDTLYTFKVAPFDSYGAEGTSLSGSSMTLPLPNDEAPTWPTAAYVSGTASATSLALNWTAAEDDYAISHYSIFLDGVLLDSVVPSGTATESHHVIGLAPGSTYTLAVIAYDLGNQQTSVAIANSFTTGALSSGQVYIPDPVLHEEIRYQLGKYSGDLTITDMQALGTVDVMGAGVTDLTGLQHAVNLTYLDLSYNNLSDISVIAGMMQLETLYLEYNQIHDISILSGLTNLSVLWLENNPIIDFSPLVSNAGLGYGDELNIQGITLGTQAQADIDTLIDRGVSLYTGGWGGEPFPGQSSWPSDARITFSDVTDTTATLTWDIPEGMLETNHYRINLYDEEMSRIWEFGGYYIGDDLDNDPSTFTMD